MRAYAGNMSEILVTGAAGFIGSHVAEMLLKKGHFVIGVDDLNDYYDPAIKKRNVAILNQFKRFRFNKIDIRNDKKVFALFKKEKFDSVIHLAARAGVRPSIENPILYETTDIKGTLTILEAIKDNKIKKLVLASSSSVYGGNKKIPFSESDGVDRPISPYAACKKANELLAYTYHHLYGINVFCLRFFTVYGPRGRPDMAVFKFTDLISKGKPIEVFGDGTTKRDYTYVNDIVEGVISALNRCKGYEIFNLGNNNPIALNKVLSLIEKNLGKGAKIKRKPLQPGDLTRTYADISKSKRKLGYNPKISIEEGIRRFVEWYKEEYK
jgi:UDP-glucuronate 4-epimerase